MAEPVIGSINEVIVEAVGYAYVEEWEDDVGIIVVRGSGFASDTMTIYYHDYEFKNRYVARISIED